MSSLQDEIFFGSKQNILDSYLRARQQRRDDSQLPKKRNVVYPNILDEISYQRSFERQERQDHIHLKPQSITIKSLNNAKINDTVFVGIKQVRLQSEILNQGVCMEMRVQLGEKNTMEELFFYSKEARVDVKDCIKVNLINCTLEEYFLNQRAKCLKIELVSKNTLYDNAIGSCFMPIESVISVLDNFCTGSSEQIKKEVTLRVLSHRKTHGDNFIKFDFVVSRNPATFKQPTSDHVFFKQQTITKQKAVIKVLQISLKEGYDKLSIQYDNKEVHIQEQTVFTIDITKDNQTLNAGILLLVTVDGRPIGKMTLPVLHIFLSQSIRGKYPVNDLETGQFRGYIQMQISEPFVGRKPNKITQAQSAILGKTSRQPLLTSTVVTVSEILLFSKLEDVSSKSFIIKCYKNSHLVISKPIQFIQTQKHFLLTSSEARDFEYISQPNNQKNIILLEIYRNEGEEEKLIGNCKFQHYGLNQQRIDIIDFIADCEALDKSEIIKVNVSIGRLTYRNGFFVHDKIQHATKLFYHANRNKISREQIFELTELKSKLHQLFGITFVEIDKILSLTGSQQPLNSEFIKAYLGTDSLIFESSINILQIYKELEYADSHHTGYISVEEFKIILSYFGIHNPLLQRYTNVAISNLKDCMFQKRKFGSIPMLNYLAFLRQCREKTGQTQKTQYQFSISQNLLTQSPIKERQEFNVEFMIVKGTNFNTLSENIKSPNAYIVQESLGFSTEVCYRNCNPQFFKILSIRNHNSEFLNFKIMHKDFKTKDSQIGAFSVSLNQIVKSKPNEFIKIRLNASSLVELQHK